MSKPIIKRCEAMGLRMTGQRRTIATVIEDSEDHPDVEELFRRAAALDAGISIATVYRTVKLFEEAGILDKLEFGDGRARYEDAERDHRSPDRHAFGRGDRICRRRDRSAAGKDRRETGL